MKLTIPSIAVFILASISAFGQHYKVLYNFTGGSDGAFPKSALLLDAAGNLYGTTVSGGNNESFCGGEGCGIVFELSPNIEGSWSETILYAFCPNKFCADGASPMSGLVIDPQGNLYGSTRYGGTSPNDGIVYELSPPSLPSGSWTEKVLYNFCSLQNCSDGAVPNQVILDTSGNLYGTTVEGGSMNHGVVFELSPSASSWSESVLFKFCTSGQKIICPTGAQPLAGVTFDTRGNLYGTTSNGGSKTGPGSGLVYELSPNSTGWIETNIYSFYTENQNQASPSGNVIFDALGNLYSTTASAGAFECGQVFKLSLQNGGEFRRVSFNCQNGNSPRSGPLLDPKSGALYGTTAGGGTTSNGVAYKISSNGNESVLYNFCQETNCADGALPFGGLVADQSGNLYGVAYQGGTYNAGVVFEITP